MREEAETEKKVSRFEGDIDLQGIDEADLEAQEVEAELTTETPVEAAGTEKAAAAPAAPAAPVKKSRKVTKGE
jgi:hypothetical protein